MRTRPWTVIALLIATLHGAAAFALDDREDRAIWEDDGPVYPGWLCSNCRDPYQYPEDFAVFAWNAYFGEDPWARDSILGIPFRVYNRQLQWVVVWFEDVLFDTPSLLPETMDIVLRLPSGQIVTVRALESGPDMWINDTSAADPTDCSCSGGSEDDDYIDADEHEDDGPDLVGVVEIEDPDENGNFDDSYWKREL